MSSSKGVFERCTSTGSKAFCLSICLDATELVQICIAKCLYSYRDDLPENWGNPLPRKEKKFTSGWRGSLKNVYLIILCPSLSPQLRPRKKPFRARKKTNNNSTHIWRRSRQSNPGHTGGRRVLFNSTYIASLKGVAWVRVPRSTPIDFVLCSRASSGRIKTYNSLQAKLSYNL